MNNFIKRTISGIGFAAIMLAAFLTNKYVFGAVMLFSLIIMMREFLKMTCGKNYWFSQILSILAGATLFSLIYLFKGFNFPGRLVILAFVPVFVLMINSLYVKDKSRFDKFSNLYAALIYIAVPWSLLNFAVFNGEGEFNGILLLCFFAIIWGTDVGAYLFGITLGQRYGKKLFPSISPKKSWIGFWGGIAMAVGVAVALHYAGLFCFDLIHCICIALLLAVTGVYGDLIESQWKRHYEVKDSGTIIPGHGGLLDRFDSALIAIPIGIIYLVVMNVL
ncbi:MAG: phosphatidate cytidylyltransferase [Bacteroidales bacterium]|nr:phosphatidate cytidylyltransferase [Bacteroidales bacterium]MBQ8808715.1 phosphatidate cytidylyltransferase [Bacteroidales bacterium]